MPEPSVDTRHAQAISGACQLATEADAYIKGIARRYCASRLEQGPAVAEVARAKAIFDIANFYAFALKAVEQNVPEAREAVTAAAEEFATTVRDCNHLPKWESYVPSPSHDDAIMHAWEMYNGFIPESLKPHLAALEALGVSVKSFPEVFRDSEQLLDIAMHVAGAAPAK